MPDWHLFWRAQRGVRWSWIGSLVVDLTGNFAAILFLLKSWKPQSLPASVSFSSFHGFLSLLFLSSSLSPSVFLPVCLNVCLSLFFSLSLSLSLSPSLSLSLSPPSLSLSPARSLWKQGRGFRVCACMIAWLMGKLMSVMSPWSCRTCLLCRLL